MTKHSRSPVCVLVNAKMSTEKIKRDIDMIHTTVVGICVGTPSRECIWAVERNVLQFLT